MFIIEQRSSIPLFQQIVDQVSRYIALGILKPHDQLPPVRTLARDLGINPNTVAKAYQECELLKLTYSIPGKGSYIEAKNEGVNILIDAAYDNLLKQYQQLIELGETVENIDFRIKEKINDPTHKCK